MSFMRYRANELSKKSKSKTDILLFTAILLLLTILYGIVFFMMFSLIDNFDKYHVKGSSIVSVLAVDDCTVGLKNDGTVVATYDEELKRDVESWTDIVSVSTGGYHIVGLKKDGTVVAAGENEDGKCDVENWTDIVSVSVGGYHIVGIKKDGTVVATGSNTNGQCDVDDWNIKY